MRLIRVGAMIGMTTALGSSLAGCTRHWGQGPADSASTSALEVKAGDPAPVDPDDGPQPTGTAAPIPVHTPGPVHTPPTPVGSFPSGKPPTRILVASTSPQAGAVGVASLTTLKVVFSHPVDSKVRAEDVMQADSGLCDPSKLIQIRYANAKQCMGYGTRAPLVRGTQIVVPSVELPLGGHFLGFVSKAKLPALSADYSFSFTSSRIPSHPSASPSPTQSFPPAPAPTGGSGSVPGMSCFSRGADDVPHPVATPDLPYKRTGVTVVDSYPSFAKAERGVSSRSMSVVIQFDGSISEAMRQAGTILIQAEGGACSQKAAIHVKDKETGLCAGAMGSLSYSFGPDAAGRYAQRVSFEVSRMRPLADYEFSISQERIPNLAQSYSTEISTAPVIDCAPIYGCDTRNDPAVQVVAPADLPGNADVYPADGAVNVPYCGLNVFVRPSGPTAMVSSRPWADQQKKKMYIVQSGLTRGEEKAKTPSRSTVCEDRAGIWLQKKGADTVASSPVCLPGGKWTSSTAFGNHTTGVLHPSGHVSFEAQQLEPCTTYLVKLRREAVGNATRDLTWSFRTAAPIGRTCGR